jgi:hypothetical protein
MSTCDLPALRATDNCQYAGSPSSLLIQHLLLDIRPDIIVASVVLRILPGLVLGATLALEVARLVQSDCVSVYAFVALLVIGLELEADGEMGNILSTTRVDISPLAQGNLAVVACARGCGAVCYRCAGELALYGLVDAGLAGWAWSVAVRNVWRAMCVVYRCKKDNNGMVTYKSPRRRGPSLQHRS